MATSTASIKFSNIAATTPAFGLKGGKYGLTVTATFGAGNVQPQTLAQDGSTWVGVGSQITTNGTAIFDLPPGQYRIAITTATAVYAALTSVPT
jgi:hypothetical protein